MHLERALEQVDNALSTASASKKPKKQDADQWLKVCQYLERLEYLASDKGETGLAISLSKPFQRLLKYPLLFQNLLFHTDPSTFEYESTLQMVAEVETIVRSIEGRPQINGPQCLVLNISLTAASFLPVEAGGIRKKMYDNKDVKVEIVRFIWSQLDDTLANRIRSS